MRHLAIPAALAAAALLLLSCGGEGRQNIVAVSGVGVVQARPDTIHMSVLMRHTADTTREAQAEVNRMAAQVLEILRGAGVEDRNVQTAWLRFSPDYEWVPQGRLLRGQMAEQSIGFSIEGIGQAGAGVASGIIDQLIEINGLELQGMHFSVRDTAELRYRARELAYQEALEKARQYARLSGQRIVRAVGVFEEAGAMPPVAFRQNMRMAGGYGMAWTSDMAVAENATLPAGEMEITARVSVHFEMR